MFSLSLGLRNHYKARAACGTTPPARLRRCAVVRANPRTQALTNAVCGGRCAYGLSPFALWKHKQSRIRFPFLSRFRYTCV